MDLQNYLCQYYEKYGSQIKDLSKTLFNPDARNSWFQTLKRLTGYHKFMKRDGSLARECMVNGQLVTGKEFGEAAARWYGQIALPGPQLEQSEFPDLEIADEELIGLLRMKGSFMKAYSVDCINSSAFSEIRSLERCCGGKCEQHRLYLSRIKYLFTREFWDRHHRLCLTGRVVLLNKDHPKIPELGRFRPIRIASFAVKLLEKFLCPELREWVQ